MNMSLFLPMYVKPREIDYEKRIRKVFGDDGWFTSEDIAREFKISQRHAQRIIKRMVERDSISPVSYLLRPPSIIYVYSFGLNDKVRVYSYAMSSAEVREKARLRKEKRIKERRESGDFMSLYEKETLCYVAEKVSSHIEIAKIRNSRPDNQLNIMYSMLKKGIVTVQGILPLSTHERIPLFKAKRNCFEESIPAFAIIEDSKSDKEIDNDQEKD